MQTIALQRSAPTAAFDLDITDSMSSDKRILSIVVIRDRKLTKTGPSIAFRADSASLVQQMSGMFKVFDLLEHITYVVSPWRQFHQLTFFLNGRLVIVTVQPDTDIVEIADDIGRQLETIVPTDIQDDQQAG